MNTETDIQPNRRLITLAVTGLCLLSLLLLGTRFLIRHFIDVPLNRDTAWHLIWDFGLSTNDPDTSLRIALPRETPYISIYSQTVDHPGLRLKRTSLQRDRRLLEVVAGKPGNYRLQLAFDLYLHTRPVNLLTPQKTLSEEERKPYLDTSDNEAILAPYSEIVTRLSESADSDQELAEQMYDVVRNRISGRKLAPVTDLARAQMLVALYRLNYLPARVVTGIELTDTGSTRMQYWVEVWLNDHWLGFDPGDGFAYELPTAYLPITYSNPEIVQLRNGGTFTLQTGIRQQTPPVDLYGNEAGIFDLFNLNRLSSYDRQALALLLILPLGALLTVFFRQVIGMHLYGTFAATLLAMSARLTDWITLLVTVLIVATFGFIGRAMLPGFNLTRLPRLGIVFTLVTISIAFSISLMRFFGYEPGESNTIVPMVVLTILVDSFYRTADKSGMHEALIRLAWTIAISLIILSVFMRESVAELLLRYPELHLITIALIILTSTWQGEKLLNRFKSLVHP